MTHQIGALIIDLESTILSPEEAELLNHPLVGGVILFARNYTSKEQLKALCASMRAARKAPLLIMVDQEGGRVQRFVNEFTRLPAMGSFGEMYNNNPATACLAAQETGCLMAKELLATGIDLSLAPVLDLNTPVSPAIGNRAFHTDPEAIVTLATAFVQGMRKAGMAATGKHFPGHGSVTIDSHKALPSDARALNDIMHSDLVPFIGLIKTGIPAIMAAHIVFSAIDEMPVGYSRIWLQEVLRGQLGFKGVIFSDDLSMEGANISVHYEDRVKMAREAGCDFTLLCNNRSGVVQTLDHLPAIAHQLHENVWSILQGQLSNGSS